LGTNDFGVLRRAAQQLIDLGKVSDVRVLQNGRVITGIAADGQRVYIQQRRPGAKMEGECSCGEPDPCVHVVAVSLVAAKLSAAPTTHDRRNGMSSGAAAEASANSPDTALPGLATQQQCLRYLMEFDAMRRLQLSAWVTQCLTRSGHVRAEATPFAVRSPDGGTNYPRYVDARDIEILDVLSSQQFDGPWELTGAAGFDLFRRLVATGRAFWRSLQAPALREGGPQELLFAWAILPNGDQQLRCESAEPLELLLQLEPALCIHTVSGECGFIELPYSVDLLRRHWHRPAIEPAEVCALNAKLSAESQSRGFPRLREMLVQVQESTSLRPRLTLAAGPTATVHFLYNGMAVDSNSLCSTEPVVRICNGDVVHHITRDTELERRLRAQLEQFLSETPRSGEAWLAFMTTGLEALQDSGWEIDIDPGFPYRIVTADDWYVDLQSTRPTHFHQPPVARPSREWFDLRLGILVDGHAVNLLPALVQYLQAATGPQTVLAGAVSGIITDEHLLLRLEDGRYLPVPRARIHRIAETLVELCDRDCATDIQALRLPAAQAGRLAQLAFEQTAPALQSNDPALLNLIDAVKGFSRIEPVAAPENFHAMLRPYQQEGLGWLQFLRRHSLGGILADDMGLGKTVQTLAHLLIEKQQNRLQQPSLIVAPVSVLGNWLHEIRRFAPELNVLILHGAKRRQSFAAIGSADIVVIGYPLLLLESELLLPLEFCFVILDEAQTIKNPQAKISQVARSLRAQHRLCLTGTPMENHLGELWSLFDFVQPGLLGERRQFERHYRIPIENGRDVQRAAALRHRIQPFLLRRTKDAVAADLPAKTQIVALVDLDERQRDFYDGIRLGQHLRVREAIQQQGLARSHITVLDALLKLRQVCCDPRLVDPDAQAQSVPSAKLDWLATMLPELIAEGRRILLFSQFTSMLQLIAALVEDLSLPYFMLTGESHRRTELVQEFQAGGVPLFLISLKAGGTGLNLTAADTIIHYDPWWNPAVEAQATDRAHRIGQDKPVFVYKLIARRTVEEKIMQLQLDKQALVSQLYADGGGAPSQLSSADVEALFAT
jgi:superfamily II DNA or RNA helicase